MENFKELVKYWVKLDNKIIENRNTNKTLEKKKKETDKKIIQFIQNEKLQEMNFKLNDNTKIVYKESISTSGITQKLLQKSLDDFFIKTQEAKIGKEKALLHSQYLFEFILKQRSNKVNYNIKRVSYK
tara:strand:- start:171 stop:554 length:384 start_codon:yes stop_codon:yes gene_type:complete